MAISKMALVNVVGPVSEFDRICANYLLNYDIHIENVTSALEHVSGLVPYPDEDPYADIIAQIEAIYQRAGLPLPRKEDVNEIEIAPDVLEEKLSDISVQLVQNEQERQQAESAVAENEQIIAQLSPLLGIDNVDVDSFFHFDFVKFRFGRMPQKSMQALKDYLYDIDAFFIPAHSDEEFVWGMYFMPQSLEEKIDAIFASLYFERTRISDKAQGTPKEATVTLELENEKLRRRIEALDMELKSVIDKNGQLLQAMYGQAQLGQRISRLRRYAGHAKDSFYIVGWMTSYDVHDLELQLRAEPDVVVVVEEPDAVEKLKPPTKLHNNFLIRPFELFVRMYGIPGYHEIDPTPLVALTYMLMFGIMFGDIGQGALLCLGGFTFAKLRGSKLGSIIGMVGISSMVFGFLYGSIFGREDIIPGLIAPMENMNFMLIAAVALGVVIITFAMILNIVNGLKTKAPARVWLSQNGIAGLIFYWVAIITALSLFLNLGPKIAPWLIGIGIGAPLVAIFLQEPLAMLMAKKENWLPKKKGMFIVEHFFELFEILLSFITNTMSFIRVGAFALNHVGMMSVVFLLSDMAGKGAGNVIVQILGNALVIGLEGLIVGIQVLRLEFYEMFSRFFIGDGKEFRSIRRADK